MPEPERPRWSVQSATTRALDVLFEEGPRALADRALWQLGVKRLLVLEKRLDAVTADAVEAVQTGLAFGQANLSDAPALAELHAELERSERPVQRPLGELQQRALNGLAAGDVCFVARSGARIVATAWVGRGAVRVGHLQCDLLLGPEDTYVYDVFVAPDARSRGVARALYAHAAACTTPTGATRMLMLVRAHNTANLRAAAHAGYRRIGVLARVSVRNKTVHLGDALCVRPWPEPP